MVECTAEEAFLLFDGWRSNNVELLCTSRLIGWNLTMGGFVLLASREEVVFGVRDRCIITLGLLTDGLTFAYAEKGARDVLAVRLPLRFSRQQVEGPFRRPFSENLFFGQAD